MENHDYLWTTEKEDWALIKTDFGYAIVNLRDQMMLLVSEANLKEYLINKMIEEGCKIYNSMEEAMRDN